MRKIRETISSFLFEEKQFRFSRFLMIALLLGWVKHALAMSLPIYALSTAGFDDRLMVNLAYSIMNGEWLGAYNSNTFIKGVGFPLFLVFSRVLGFSYLSAVSLFYIGSCILFIRSIQPMFKRAWQAVLVYGILLFNPVTIGYTTQRVYRNGLTPSQVLLILGCCFAIFLRRKDPLKKWWGWAVGAFASVGFFWQTREDAIWIAPFLIIFLIIMVVLFLKEQKALKDKIKKSLAAFLPILGIPVSILLVSAVNYHYYGVFICNELSQGSFSDALQAMYTAQTDTPEIEYVTVSQEKLEQLYTYSPSLEGIQEELTSWSELFSTYDRNPEDGEVEDGYFFWVLRLAAEEAGYYESPQKADAFFAQVAAEIQSAVDSGALEKTWSMPSALMPPWRTGNFGKLMNALGECLTFSISWDGEFMVQDGNGGMGWSDEDMGIALFEAVTNNVAIYPDVPYQDVKVLMTAKFTRIPNIISKIYQKTGVAVMGAGFLTYIALTVCLCRKSVRKKIDVFPQWLVLTAIGCNILMLCAGISYNHISCCHTICQFYLSGVYPMIILFWTLALIWGLNTFGACRARSGVSVLETETESKEEAIADK